MNQPAAVGFDLRDLLFEDIRGRRFVAQIRAHSGGVLSGIGALEMASSDIGVALLQRLPEGAPLHSNTIVAELAGTPKQIALCEESLIGLVAKCSGVATTAARAMRAAGRIRVVCGAWKKMPSDMRQSLRRAITAGGIPTRLVDGDFVYMDKNYVRMLGGLRETLTAAAGCGHRVKAIQIRGETGSIASEALLAVECGANILMVDTGRVDDIRTVSTTLSQHFIRAGVRIAFAGGVRIEDLPALQQEDIDIVDIGRAIIDAPLLDMTLDVTGPHLKSSAATKD